jgi:hypothetical protein
VLVSGQQSGREEVSCVEDVDRTVDVRIAACCESRSQRAVAVVEPAHHPWNVEGEIGCGPAEEECAVVGQVCGKQACRSARADLERTATIFDRPALPFSTAVNNPVAPK